MTARKSSYRSLASLERDLSRCRACVEAGYPLESLPVRVPGDAASARTSSARRPASSKGEERLPWRGRAGRTLRRWLELEEDEFYATLLLRVGHALLSRAAPPSGRGDRTPTPREQELCSFWRDWELELLRPRLIVTVGGLALRRLLGLHVADAVRRRALRAGRHAGRPAPAPVRRERLAATTRRTASGSTAALSSRSRAAASAQSSTRRNQR